MDGENRIGRGWFSGIEKRGMYVGSGKVEGMGEEGREKRDGQ